MGSMMLISEPAAWVCSDKAIGKDASLMKRLGYKNTDLHLYPGMRHEILNERNHLQAWKDVLARLA